MERMFQAMPLAMVRARPNCSEFLHSPTAGAAGIVMIQEWWGVTDQVHSLHQEN